ncbi:type II toxin-antitoxin system RelE/ParE family toxin [Herbidospora yilanensis]|uniref:type II toxin-antitoxin system RelE/ParE family toxin n=1 Tax=Herbidospora yilanensis TaxID=354426 RepID=UPI000784E71C|nr:type II toxin-antitoxin system RelE/ParE family toxin [Herbidospora yilanensis]
MVEIALEPEVEAWLAELPFGHYQRVMAKVDRYLWQRCGQPDGDHVKSLREGVSELRVPLHEQSWRITFWRPGGGTIILLTVFAKTRNGPQHDDVERAVKAMRACQSGHDMSTTHVFDRRS